MIQQSFKRKEDLVSQLQKKKKCDTALTFAGESMQKVAMLDLEDPRGRRRQKMGRTGN